jgi:hypothetical protein
MSQDIQKIAEAFTTHKFAETYQYLSDDIRWENIGRETLVGREAVIARCEAAKTFLATVSTTFTKMKITRAESIVIVEGECLFTSPGGEASRVASCDVFEFSSSQLLGITSYVIDLND